MRKDLKNLTKLVEKILRDKPYTRDSDDRLYLEVIRITDKEYLNMQLGTWLMCRASEDFHLSSLLVDVAGNCRENIQNLELIRKYRRTEKRTSRSFTTMRWRTNDIRTQ